MIGSTHEIFESLSTLGMLLWLPERGVGYYPVSDFVYDAEYFAKYQRYADTDTGASITQARVALVERHACGPVMDVGIGCGQFLERMNERESSGVSVGYDVSQCGVDWLVRRGIFADYYRPPDGGWPSVTFWDSLEHMPRPADALACVGSLAFVSLPIFSSAEHILRSKHFRRDEHYWYWTMEGFERFVGDEGFIVLEHSTVEQESGREDIHSFVLMRTRR